MHTKGDPQSNRTPQRTPINQAVMLLTSQGTTYTGFLEHRVEKGFGDLLTSQYLGRHHTQAFWSTG